MSCCYGSWQCIVLLGLSCLMWQVYPITCGFLGATNTLSLRSQWSFSSSCPFPCCKWVCTHICWNLVTQTSAHVFYCIHAAHSRPDPAATPAVQPKTKQAKRKANKADRKARQAHDQGTSAAAPSQAPTLTLAELSAQTLLAAAALEAEATAARAALTQGTSADTLSLTSTPCAICQLPEHSDLYCCRVSKHMDEVH